MTPFKYSVITVIADITICLVFFFLLQRWGIGFVGIALGTGLAAWINATLLYRRLRRRGFLVLDQRLKRNLPRLVVANLVMAGVLIGGRHLLAPWLAGAQGERIASLCVLVGAAAAIYFLIVLLLGAYTLADLKRHALRR